VLDHYDGIGACRDSRSGHDLHTLAGTNYAIETAAGLDFANAAQRGAGCGVIRAQGKPITNRTIEWWVVAIRCDGLH
jgi:hypothetical protein